MTKIYALSKHKNVLCIWGDFGDDRVKLVLSDKFKCRLKHIKQLRLDNFVFVL